MPFLTPRSQRSMRLALVAGLKLEPGGPVFVRGMEPAQCYVPSGAWL